MTVARVARLSETCATVTLRARHRVETSMVSAFAVVVPVALTATPPEPTVPSRAEVALVVPARDEKRSRRRARTPIPARP